MSDVLHDPETGEVLDHKGRRLNAAGQEMPDPEPMAPPIGFVRQPPLHELIRQMVRSEALRVAAEEQGAGSFEEEDDFDVDDEFDPTSPWEEQFDPPPEVPASEPQPPVEAARPSEAAPRDASVAAAPPPSETS